MDENPYKTPSEIGGGRLPSAEEIVEREYTKDTIWLLISAAIGFFVISGLFMAGRWFLDCLGISL